MEKTKLTQQEAFAVTDVVDEFERERKRLLQDLRGKAEWLARDANAIVARIDNDENPCLLGGVLSMASQVDEVIAKLRMLDDHIAGIKFLVGKLDVSAKDE